VLLEQAEEIVAHAAIELHRLRDVLVLEAQLRQHFNQIGSVHISVHRRRLVVHAECAHERSNAFRLDVSPLLLTQR
jgi:hypothetical protein